MKQIPIQLTPIQKEMLDNGASYVIDVIDIEKLVNGKPFAISIHDFTKDEIYRFLDYKIGDEIFFQEKFLEVENNNILYAYDVWSSSTSMYDIRKIDIYKPSEHMTYEQSRYKYKILDIEIVRVQDIGVEYFTEIYPKDDLYWVSTDYKDKLDDFKDNFNQLMQQQNKTARYEDDILISLIKIKE